MFPPDAFLALVNQALEQMLHICEELGEELINRRPNVPGANSPYVILAHCVGLTHYWIGRVCAGRPYTRDRDAEFRAQGSLAEIQQAVFDLQKQLQEDMQGVRMDQPIMGELDARHTNLQQCKQGEILLRCFKELAQHHGHMDLTRDLFLQA